ncbi:MAG: hypothetical protein ABSH49_18785 [Bryobacteraceae bacterium]
MHVRDLGTRPAPASIRELFARMVRGHGPAITVQRRQVPYWQERGWTRQGTTLYGSYQTPYGTFWGQITEHRGGHIDFWIYQPSDQIRNCSHWACFQHRGNDWYLIHMAKEPRDIGSGILAIERLFTEAYEQ